MPEKNLYKARMMWQFEVFQVAIHPKEYMGRIDSTRVV